MQDMSCDNSSFLQRSLFDHPMKCSQTTYFDILHKPKSRTWANTETKGKTQVTGRARGRDETPSRIVCFLAFFLFHFARQSPRRQRDNGYAFVDTQKKGMKDSLVPVLETLIHRGSTGGQRLRRTRPCSGQSGPHFSLYFYFYCRFK